MNKPFISIVSPVYGCKKAIPELCKRLHDTLVELDDNYEIILVDDCSPDNSWEDIVSLASENNKIKGIKFSRNFGQHHAITAGLDYAKGDWIVVMDCDLQDPPEAIKQLFDKAQEGYDIVRARRIERQDNIIKKTLSKLFYMIFSYLTDTKYDSYIGNFRIISRKVNDSLKTMKEQTRAFSIMVDWTGFAVCDVDIIHAKRDSGKSSYTVKKLLNLALLIIFANTDKPLRLIIKFGFIISFLSFIYAAYLIIRKLIYDITIPGWSSIIVSMYLLGGVIIAILGIIGIYVGKVYDEVKNKPIYIISKTTESIVE